MIAQAGVDLPQEGRPIPFASLESAQAALPPHMWSHLKHAQLALQISLDLAHILLVSDTAQIRSPGSSRRSSGSSSYSRGQAFSASLRSQRSSLAEVAQSLLRPATMFLQNFGGCPLPKPSAPTSSSAPLVAKQAALQEVCEALTHETLRWTPLFTPARIS